MTSHPENIKLAVSEADYLLQGHSIREVAWKFCRSKTSVHRDLTKVLPQRYPHLYECVIEHLDKNFKEGHIKGGEVTKRQWDDYRRDMKSILTEV
jgi:putative DeoR family transcriptional regulator (stage III sporulation protein D)